MLRRFYKVDDKASYLESITPQKEFWALWALDSYLKGERAEEVSYLLILLLILMLLELFAVFGVNFGDIRLAFGVICCVGINLEIFV